MERADFLGYEYEFSPLNSSYISSQPLQLDLGFNFLDSAVRADTQRWHYPCLASLECSVVVAEEVSTTTIKTTRSM